MATRLDHYRLLGRSGLRVSPLCLGTMTFGSGPGWGTDEAEARRIFNRYTELGGNSIDTANFYSMGESERIVGKLVEGVRQRYVIATKYSLTMQPGDPNASGNHRKNMVQAVEASLKRLGTDYIDLLYLHIWDSRTPVDEILRGFDDLVRAGKIVYTGLSDTPAWQASRMQAIAELRGWSTFAALQIPYNLTERAVERDLMPMAMEMGMGVLPWSPLAGGVLSGKYAKQDLGSGALGNDVTALSRKKINAATGRLTERNLEIAAVAGQVAEEIGCSAAQVALAWTLLHPSVTSPILGTRTFEQLEANLGALDVKFSDAQIARLEASSGFELGFPHDFLKSPAMDMMFGNVTVASRR